MQVAMTVAATKIQILHEKNASPSPAPLQDIDQAEVPAADDPSCIT